MLTTSITHSPAEGARERTTGTGHFPLTSQRELSRGQNRYQASKDTPPRAVPSSSCRAVVVFPFDLNPIRLIASFSLQLLLGDNLLPTQIVFR